MQVLTYMADGFVDATTPRKLLDILQVDEQGAARDEARCIRSRHTMEPALLDRVIWVLQSAQLRTWIGRSTRSSELLIHGNRHMIGVESPTSLLCAHLSNMLAPNRHAVVVSYLCGMHSRYQTWRHDAKGMLVSLIGQLLGQRKAKGFRFCLSGIKKRSIARHGEDNLQGLCDVFSTLVDQLPEEMVLFCLIDGISSYESLERKDDTLRVFEMLQDLTVRQTKVLVKVLLTAPNKTRYIHQYIEPSDVVLVPEDVDGGGHGVLSKLDSRRLLEEATAGEWLQLLAA